ncbi:MAG TPA: hypothetical protein ENJ28_07985 [Gammaproteobacteria bacterium]|nr:hypothetical protein [Gammaproteobacteria bacterium]
MALRRFEWIWCKYIKLTRNVEEPKNDVLLVGYERVFKQFLLPLTGRKGICNVEEPSFAVSELGREPWTIYLMAQYIIQYRRLILVFLVLAGTSCTSYETKLYEGKVVDEQGDPIQNVSIKLCYVGLSWDWNMAGGFPLTLDHAYCSDSVVTDQSGDYKVVFAGPPSTFIIARHPDWVQTKNFLANDNRVVLVRRDINKQRIAKKEKEREKVFRQRKPHESVFEYYCRVIRKRSNEIEIIYHGYQIKVSDALLVHNDKAIFALYGPQDVVRDVAKEVVIGAIGLNDVQETTGNITVFPNTANCDSNTYFIVSIIHDSRKPSISRNEDITKIEFPGIRAAFTMKIWKLK